MPATPLRRKAEAADDGAATPLDGFDYVQVDDYREAFSDSTAFFGLAFGDLDGDGRDDIASGRYVYSNPGGDLSASWERTDLADSVGAVVDAMLVTDVDGDSRADVIATSLPDVWWLEAGDRPGRVERHGRRQRAGDIPPERAGVSARGPDRRRSRRDRAERWCIRVRGLVRADSGRPERSSWPTVRITDKATDEQIGIGDINGDGFADVSAGDMNDGGAYIAWFENPGDGSDDWTRHRLGEFPGVFPDRMELVDLDGDGRLDVVVTEENDGTQPNAEVMWYEQPEDPYSSDWERHVIVTQYTTNGLDAADLDGDGDIDLTTGEHRGTKKVAIWENDGVGADGRVQWIEHPVDEGKESHLGARVWDLDGDGDMEIVSIGFDEPTGSPPLGERLISSIGVDSSSEGRLPRLGPSVEPTDVQRLARESRFAFEDRPWCPGRPRARVESRQFGCMSQGRQSMSDDDDTDRLSQLVDGVDDDLLGQGVECPLVGSSKTMNEAFLRALERYRAAAVWPPEGLECPARSEYQHPRTSRRDRWRVRQP